MKYLGVEAYVSPRQRELTRAETRVRDCAYALKTADPAAIREAVRVMTPHVLPCAVLIPIPDHEGRTAANLALCRALQEAMGVGGVTIFDGLYRRSAVESSRERRVRGLAGLSVGQHGIALRARRFLPAGPLVLVDNVVATGATFQAAAGVLPRDVFGLAYARAGGGVTMISKKDVYDPVQQSYRVDFAVAVMLRGGQTTRSFDTCFEMGDGDDVAARLYGRALRNPKLMSALPRYIGLDGARECWEKRQAIKESV